MRQPRKNYLTVQGVGAEPMRIMGPAGPLRIFSTTPFQGGIPYESREFDGYAGQYVCDICLKPSNGGIYRVGENWLCGPCKSSPEARKDQSLSLPSALLATG